MISLKDYCNYDGLGLAELVAGGEVTPGELADAAWEAIERLNPELNAVLQVLRHEASAEIAAGLPEGPFRGVPFGIKELVLHARNVRCDMGSRLAQGYVPTDDSELMARFRRAGLVTVATTQTPELGYNPTTETVLFGPVRNPWNPSHSAGGSSGGSGAAVAAGILPLAHANDGGGSIRIPASANGLVGLKPTRDRVPTGPDYGDPLCGWAIEFAVTRSVRDSAALLDAVAGPDVGAPGHIAPPQRPYRDEVGAPPGRLRIAWTAQSFSGEPIDPDCEAAVTQTVALLEELGHELVEARPALDWATFLDHTHVVWVTYNAAAAESIGAERGRVPGPENLEAVTWACVEDGRRYSAVDLIHAFEYSNQLSRAVGAFFTGYDAFVTPTMARPAVPLGEVNQNAAGLSARGWTDQVFRYCAFTPLFNTTGQPAISLPLHWTADGRPVGVQFAGRFGDEATLLRIAAQLEEARPWAERRPPLHAASV